MYCISFAWAHPSWNTSKEGGFFCLLEDGAFSAVEGKLKDQPKCLGCFSKLETPCSDYSAPLKHFEAIGKNSKTMKQSRKPLATLQTTNNNNHKHKNHLKPHINTVFFFFF